MQFHHKLSNARFFDTNSYHRSQETPVAMVSNVTEMGENGENADFQPINRSISETILIDFWYPLDCLHRSWDWTGLITLIELFLVRFLFYSFLFILCGRPSWLPVSFDCTTVSVYSLWLRLRHECTCYDNLTRIRHCVRIANIVIS